MSFRIVSSFTQVFASSASALLEVVKETDVDKLQEIPPFNGFGSMEDSLQSCLSLIPQPPKKDFIKMLENDGRVLRYECVMVSDRG